MPQKISTAQLLFDLADQAVKAKKPNRAQLESELFTIKAREREIERELLSANVILQRLSDYKPANSGINTCPFCWIDGDAIDLYGIPSDTQDDLLRCPKCRQTIRIEWE